jgi:hypothetical protein
MNAYLAFKVFKQPTLKAYQSLRLPILFFLGWRLLLTLAGFLFLLASYLFILFDPLSILVFLVYKWLNVFKTAIVALLSFQTLQEKSVSWQKEIKQLH